MNQRGFGLIELLVGVVVMSIIALGTATLVNHSLLVTQTATIKTNLTSLVSSTAGIASNIVTCTQAITQVSQAYNPNQIQFNGLSPGVTLPNYNLTIGSIVFNAPQLVETGTDGSTVYQGTLMLQASSTVPIYGKTMAPRVIEQIYIQVNPGGAIVGCGVVMPTLPNVVTAPEVNISTTSPVASNADTVGCTAIGGEYANGVCLFPQAISQYQAQTTNQRDDSCQH